MGKYFNRRTDFKTAFQLMYHVLAVSRRRTRVIPMMNVINSAAGIVIHMPVMPNRSGYNIIPVHINTSPRIREIITDLFASPNEVKKLENRMLMPLSRKANAQNAAPVDAIAIVSVASSLKKNRMILPPPKNIMLKSIIPVINETPAAVLKTFITLSQFPAP